MNSPHFTRDPSNLYAILTDNITFTDNGNGTYSYSSSQYWFYECSFFENTLADQIAVPESGTYTVLSNHIITNFNWDNFPPPIKQYSRNAGLQVLQKITKNRFLWIHGGSALNNFLACHRQNIPPPAPTDLSAAVSGMNVTLTWMNICSSTATSLEILRKDTLTGNYSPVAALPATVTSYTGTIPSTGTYWYRIVAVNAYGDSVGSNVADVTAE